MDRIDIFTVIRHAVPFYFLILVKSIFDVHPSIVAEVSNTGFCYFFSDEIFLTVRIHGLVGADVGVLLLQLESRHLLINQNLFTSPVGSTLDQRANFTFLAINF